MRRRAVQFIAPGKVSVVEESLKAPTGDQVLVETLVSAVSAGTELLIYRGEWPPNLPVDESIPALQGAFQYPLKYGYACVGRVLEMGSKVDPSWTGKLVFAFNPHESHFLSRPEDLVPLPSDLPPERAGLLPNMETAVAFVMDGRPLIGERVVVFGQGVVGLLTTALLSRFSLGGLYALDRFPMRRDHSLALGADSAFDPADPLAMDSLMTFLEIDRGGGADLTYELSGNPAALDQAISVTGFGGRVVVGSWYGAKRADIDLGGKFHRGRIRLISSQVSTIEPELSGRWTKKRRLNLAIGMLRKLNTLDLISHRFPISNADEAYALLAQNPEDALQVVLTYEG
ncbi:MAG: zinc-binding alcohol dehydrogenase [Thermodesulfobacteriota bacterium]